MNDKQLIFIPTYNESGNVEKIFNEIIKLNLGTDILFLDDNSPDGTGQIIDKLVEQNSNVFVIHRKDKQGIGSAHLDGIHWAYTNGYQTLITMDCDFAHSPNYLPEFIKHGNTHDIVVGSRYMKEGSLKEWSLMRKILTHTGHFLTATILKMPYDATGAFRVYRLDRIPLEIFDLTKSLGYSFFFESLFILNLNKHPIKEVPIDLPARVYGQSKMRLKDVFQSVWRLVSTAWQLFFKRESFIYWRPHKSTEEGFVANENPYVSEDGLTAAQVEKDWDQYWTGKKKSASVIYDIIAVFYRKFIIKPSLNKFLRKAYDPNAKLLHAGCGSGQVDEDVGHWFDITAMDISVPALDIYRKYNGSNCKTIHGDIFEIPAEDETYDGVYNLGVMEHFSSDENYRILKEFYRVTKPNAKIVIFWPPEFGLSVRFLKMVHYILNDLLKKNIKLHPDEISRVQSKEQIDDVFAKTNFKMVEYSFGIGDMFTHSIIVAEKMPLNGLSKEQFAMEEQN